MGGLGSHAYTITKEGILGFKKKLFMRTRQVWDPCELCLTSCRAIKYASGRLSWFPKRYNRRRSGTKNGRERQFINRRCGSVDDVAHAVLFLASDESGFITGHNLVIDGGYTTSSISMTFIYRDKKKESDEDDPS
ncbi:hypothetical protein L1987_26389 [Smallanthus sonchifolius]|uniref:Uncharacterized protein n=1 Tax=Smallanthus sonchifolius TaxID=185202 RepID=A0ACB9IAY6_9ASTR|nr:hypothetical protein L1987_26389 [Smallanthus sonchifolius]